MVCEDVNDMELHDKKKYLTKSEVLEREWTDLAIERFLGEPERIRPNHLYRNTKSIKLYAENRVLKMEKTEEYQKFLEKKNKGQRGASKKRNKKR